MADFDVIVLQEVPGTEKVMNEKVETFAAMLEIATEEGQFWTAVSSQKSGKDGKVVGPGAEVHVCFVKSPVEFPSWNTLRKVGATELDYAPLQVELHDPRFADPADQRLRGHERAPAAVEARRRARQPDRRAAAQLRGARHERVPHAAAVQAQQGEQGRAHAHHRGGLQHVPGHEQYNMLGSGFVSQDPQGRGYHERTPKL